MTRFLAAAVVLASAPSFADEDVAARAFVEIDTGRPTCFVGERVTIRVLVGIDEEFFRTRGVPMFRRSLDVPVQVEAPWTESLPGGGEVPPPDDPSRTATLALGDRVVDARRVGDAVRDGRSFAVLEIARTAVFDGPGEVALSAPMLRFAWATRFDDDLVLGAVPLDRRDAVVAGKPAPLRILPLPEGGRPASFTGAVGRFAVEADATPREVEAGTSLRFVLRVNGDGDLARFAAPDLGATPGFRVYGLLDDVRDDARTFAWDVAPLAPGTVTLPAVEFASFDPEPPGSWRVVRTDPIALTVRGAAVGDGARAANDGDGDAAPESPVHVLALVAAGLAAAVAGAILLRRRRTAAALAGVGETSAEDAAVLLRRLAADDPQSLGHAFPTYLADRLGTTEAAVVSPDLGRRLIERGVAPELAERTASLVERLVGARYRRALIGAEDIAETQALVLELAPALETYAQPT